MSHMYMQCSSSCSPDLAFSVTVVFALVHDSYAVTGHKIGRWL